MIWGTTNSQEPFLPVLDLSSIFDSCTTMLHVKSFHWTTAHHTCNSGLGSNQLTGSIPSTIGMLTLLGEMYGVHPSSSNFSLQSTVSCTTVLWQTIGLMEPSHQKSDLWSASISCTYEYMLFDLDNTQSLFFRSIASGDSTTINSRELFRRVSGFSPTWPQCTIGHSSAAVVTLRSAKGTSHQFLNSH